MAYNAGTKRTKKVDDFRFRHDGKEVEIPLYLVKDNTGGCSFQIREDALGINLTHTDIAVLREEAQRQLTDKTTVEWDFFARIVVKSDKPNSTKDKTWKKESADLKIEMDFFAVGKDSRGAIINAEVRNPLKAGVEWDGRFDRKTISQWHHAGKPNLARESYSEDVHTAALLPATPETIAAVRAFQDRIRALSAEIHRRFHKDAVEDTLAAIRSGGGLPALPAGTPANVVDAEAEEE